MSGRRIRPLRNGEGAAEVSEFWCACSLDRTRAICNRPSTCILALPVPCRTRKCKAILLLLLLLGRGERLSKNGTRKKQRRGHSEAACTRSSPKCGSEDLGKPQDWENGKRRMSHTKLLQLSCFVSSVRLLPFLTQTTITKIKVVALQCVSRIVVALQCGSRYLNAHSFVVVSLCSASSLE